MSVRALENNLENLIAGTTPSCQIHAAKKGREILRWQYGKSARFFDLASLTKIIFTTTYLMRDEMKHNILLPMPLRFPLAWLQRTPPTLRIQRLLNHTAGYEWWRPYFKMIDRKADSRAARWESLQVLLQNEKPHFGGKSVYSDLDFLLLAFVLMTLEDRDLLDVWSNLTSEVDMGTLHFNPDRALAYSRVLYAPTEKRKQGIVHDENTEALGGVSTHAGLFGTLDDVAQWGQQIRRLYHGQKKSWGTITAPTVKHFATRSLSKSIGDWGLGFMLTTPGKSGTGQYFSDKTFGHWGFTGTSWWHDPKNDLTVTILSNRVCPTRDNRAFVEARPKIHDAIFKYAEEL